MPLGKTLLELRKTDENSKDRKEFIETYEEITYYGYAQDYKEKLYSKMDAYFGKMDNAQLAKINRAAEYVEIVGSYCYPNNPDCSVNTDENADIWKQRRNKTEERLLDTILAECDEGTHLRRAVNEALMSGRGMVWMGWNERKMLPQAVFDSVKNFGWDSSATTQEDVGYTWRKRSKPKWWLKQAFPESADKIDEKSEGKKPNDLVEYYEFDFKVNPYNFCEHIDGEEIVWNDIPMTVTILEDQILKAKEWPVRYDLIDGWRFVLVDYRQRPGKIWPSAPMEPGLCHLRNMNWLYTLFVERTMTTSKLVWAVAETPNSNISDEAISQALSSMVPDGTAIKFKTNSPDTKITDLIQRFPLDTAIAAFDQGMALFERMWQDSTSLNDLVRSGQDGRQLRTAADVDFKSKRSMTRIEDMKTLTVDFVSKVVQHLALTARTLMTKEDVTQRLGKEAGAVWGMNEPDDQEGIAKMELEAREQQAQFLIQQQEMMIQEGMAQGIPPTEPPLTPEALEEKLGPPQFVNIKDWIYDANREVVGGSMRPMDHDAQIDNLNFLLGTVSPMLPNIPGGQKMLAAGIKLFTDLNRYPIEIRQIAKEMVDTVTKMQDMAMSAPPQMPPNPVPGEEPPQGAEQAIKGQNQ